MYENFTGKGPKLTFPAETMWTWAAGKTPRSPNATFAKRTPPPPAECVIPKTARHYLNQNFYLPNGLFIGNTSLEKVKVILHDSDSPKPHILSIQTFLFFNAPYSFATISIYGVYLLSFNSLCMRSIWSARNEKGVQRKKPSVLIQMT